MIKARMCFLGLLSLFLVACDGQIQEPATTEAPLSNPPTAKSSSTINFSVKLSLDETDELDPRSQGGFDSFSSTEVPESTYHYKSSMTLFDGEESAYQLEVFFILSSATARSWEIRAKLDGVTLAAVDQDSSGDDMNDSLLIFDNQGSLDAAASTNNGIIEYISSDLSVEQLHLDFSTGSREQAGNYFLDSIWLSIEGKGFFVTSAAVDSSDRLFTRVGDFRRRADGYVVNDSNEPLMMFPVNADGSISTISLTSLIKLKLPVDDGLTTSTSEIEIAVNLPATASERDPLLFDASDPTTYTASTALSIFDSLGQSHIVTLHFLKLLSPPAINNSWAQYFSVDGIAVDIVSGVVGANGQRYAEINFDGAGNFVDTNPETLITEPLVLTNGADDNQTIRIQYDADLTTQSNNGFGISRLQNNSQPALSSVDIADNGLVRAYFNNNTSTVMGKISLVSFRNPQDLATKQGSSSLLATISAGNPIPGEAKTQSLGSIDVASLKTPNPVYSEYPYSISINGEGYFLTSAEQDSQQFYVSKQSSYRTDKDGFVINQSGEFLRVFYADDGVISPVIDSIELSSPFFIPQIRGAAKLTSEIEIGVNLPSTANPLDILQFDPADPVTFSAGTALSIIDSLGATHVVRFYLLKDDAGDSQWAVYVFVDDQPVDIIGGNNGAAGQLYALLTFDGTGALQSIFPMPGSFTAIFNNGADPQAIQLMFENSTESPGSFTVQSLDHNGYITSELLGIDIDENGIITNRWSSGDNSIYGWIPLLTIGDTDCLLPVSDSESSILDGSCSFTTGEPGGTGFGTIDFSFNEFE